MKEITYNNIVDILLQEFPEYKQSRYYNDADREFLYASMGSFGRFIVQIIENEAHDSKFIQRFFEFINQIYNGPEINNKDGSDTLQNLLYVEIFENLAQTKLGVESARRYLQGKAKIEFESIFKFTGVEDGNYPIK